MSRRARPQVLIVGAEPAARGLLTRILTDSGYSVAAADAARALGRRSAPALAIIDIGSPSRLPDLTPVQLISDLASRWPDTPLLVSGAVEDRPLATACMKAGAYDCLLKPFNLDDVVLRAARALERHRLATDSTLDQAQLQAQVRKETMAARRMLLGAVKSLSSALEAKDGYTRGHSERVSRLAASIAAEIGLHSQDTRRLRVASRLHDVGKIGVRESVLSKPGPLSQDEYKQMQAHPVIGERILSPVLLDSLTVRIVRHHHEHYGGGGYPDNLHGSQIPFGARVLAVADAYDALTSDRSYRARLTIEAALDVLQSGAGSQWQPTLIEALAQVVTRSSTNPASNPDR